MCQEKIEYAIEVNNVSKAYKMFSNPSDRLKQSFTSKKLYKEFWALKNVSFKIKKGGVVGIVGRNGSGKSTLLQVLTGTLEPTEGNYIINGKIAALLELGSGFNPEYTGRENAYLCGSIYGITRSEMDKRIKDIESFADIGEFIDQPVKSYSSGMFARLAFAVNINVDADILIVDEVLSVGDHFFQAKCMSAINSLMKKGVTILMVSHSQATIKALCSSAILLSKGVLISEGDCDDVMDDYMALSLSEEREYREKMMPSSGNIVHSSGDSNLYISHMLPAFEKRITERFGNKQAVFVEAAIFQNGIENTVIQNREKAKISIWLKANENIDVKSEVGVVIRTFEGIDLFACNTFFENIDIGVFREGCIKQIDFEFEVGLGPGKYSVALGMRSPLQGDYVDKVFNAIIFDVIDSTSKTIPLLFDVPASITVID